MITTIIVDDEQNISDSLKHLLETGHPDMEVVAVCRNIKEAVAALNKFQPNLVFLDVELENNEKSFDLLCKLSDINFGIIFITGFNRYAIQAIKFSAIDYLLKPIDENELNQAIQKFKAEDFKTDFNKVESFLTAWTNPGYQQNKIPLPTMTGYDLFTVADIIYCEGVSSQTLFVLNNNTEVLTSMTLKECEDLLTIYSFSRIHKSYLINLHHAKKYIKGNDGTGKVVMSNSGQLNVSRGFREHFINSLKAI